MAFIFPSKYELLILIISMLAFSFCPTVVVLRNSDGKDIFTDKVKKTHSQLSCHVWTQTRQTLGMQNLYLPNASAFPS